MTALDETPEGSRLFAELRALRERTGLSLVGLAARTAYSKSSWQRYLNGRKLPPRDAVEQLCRLAGAYPQHCVALWELADAAWSGRSAAVGPGQDTGRSLPSAVPGGPVWSVPGPHTGTDRPADAAGEGAPTVRPGPVGDLGPPGRVAAGPVPWWRRTAVLLTGVGVLCGALTVAVLLLWPEQRTPAGPPRAGCTDSACDGRDPLGAETGCGANSPITLGSYRLRDGRMWLDLRYAKACHAGWARVYGQRSGDRIAVSVPGKSPQSLYIRDDADAHDRRPTPMLGTRDPQALRVCFTPVETGERQCHRAKR